MTSQYGAYALNVGLARLHARTRMYTPMRPGTHMHAHAEIYNTYSSYSATIIRKHASILRYTYIICVVQICFIKPVRKS